VEICQKLEDDNLSKKLSGEMEFCKINPYVGGQTLWILV
jgi:hypothetical protein